MSKIEENKQSAAKRLGISEIQIPKHIAIIMDGNGRWATERGLPRFEGHRQGAKTVEDIVLHGVNVGLEGMSLYSFSMQNWKRPQEEIDYLMHLYSRYLEEIRPMLMEHQVKLLHLGRRKPLPQMVLDALDTTVDLTKNNPGMKLGLALNYGSRTELIDAFRAVAAEHCEGKLKLDDIDEDCISNHLYTAAMPDPDLLIRTSGEMRFSNFLLWQISYTEFYVTDKYWPDFDVDEMDKAILAFAGRARRFGDVKAQIPDYSS